MPLLEVSNIRVSFPIHGGLFRRRVGEVRAVDDVSFTVEAGETVGLVGESGSGKTTIGRTIVRLQKPDAGSIVFNGQEITQMAEKEFRPLRRKIQMIFQDPYGSLNPRMRIGEILEEPLLLHFPNLSRPDRLARVAELLRLVDLKPEMAERYPHAFSGGQRQRIGIARALAVEPRFIVCDEPVSALDVSVQAQIVNLLQNLQERLGIAYLFIAHDLAVVEHISNRILVMHHGKLVESGSAAQIYENPAHDYTKRLLAAVPKI